jgi:hypothetical protein
MMKRSPEPPHSVFRPADTEELCEALLSGDVCEVPNKYAMKVFGALAYHGISAEIEVDRHTKRWTTYTQTKRK